MAPLVSVIVPAYNAQAWLADAVASALNQDWPRLEVIVVDDASRDGTLEVARRLASRRVDVVEFETNRGAAAARNAGMARAQGRYLQFLDADDLLAPDKVSLQLRAAAESGSERVLLSGAFGEFHVDPAQARFSPSPLWQDLAPVEFLLHKFSRGAWMSPAVWLVGRELADAAGPWDERLSLDDDGEYFTRVVAASAAVRFVGAARAYYRRAGTTSLSRGVNERAAASLLLSLQLCVDRLLELEPGPRARQAALTGLQHWVDRGNCCDPGRPDQFAVLQGLAQRLGGSLQPPRLAWKYRGLRLLLGWQAVRRARAAAAGLRLRREARRERRAARVADRGAV